MRVAAIQMTSGPNKSQNLGQARELIEQAKSRGAQFVALPENFSLLTGDRKQLRAEAETLQGMTVETLQEWAAEYDLWILGGSLPMRGRAAPASRGKDRLTNTSVLINPEGEIVARYDKINLFDAEVTEQAGARRYRESVDFKPGKKVVTAKTPWGSVGLSICFDLRFGELYRTLAVQGACVLFIPSAFTAVTGKAHWDVLTRARAIENQAFVVAPAQAGSPYPGRETHGHTRIIDPWGRIIAEQSRGPGVVVATLDFEQLERVRKGMKMS